MIELRAYEGLIHNYRELADELGVSIDGLTRREREERIVVAAWEAWGTSMGAHINGQFAIELYNSETYETFCTRDPLGAELLFYYRTVDGRLLVATQIKDLFDQPGFKRELNRELIQFYLGFNYVPGEETLFKGVRKLEPGGYLTFSSAGLKLGRYWELTFDPDESKSLEEWADELDAAFDASLDTLIDEGEEYDSFLSSGVDSSYILAKSQAKKAYCVSYDDPSASEEDDAQKTAETFGRGFEGIKVTSEEFFAAIDDFLYAYEQPTADVAGLALFCACRQIAKESKLCLSGEGADEFFGGYGIYHNAKRYNKDSSVYFGATYIMADFEQKRFLKHWYANRKAGDFMRERGAGGRKYDTVGWMLYTDLRSYFEASILFNSTKIVRGTGLDIRMPYCDLRIFDIARRMPSTYKVGGNGGNKLVLRAAASRVLPHEVAYRKKLGFPVPARKWLAEPDVSAEIRRAFESKTAAEFFNVDEINALLDAFLGQKPRVSHPIWFGRRKTRIWRHVWVIYLFIRWYDLFFGDGARD